MRGTHPAAHPATRATTPLPVPEPHFGIGGLGSGQWGSVYKREVSVNDVYVEEERVRGNV
jgi:hypothetical protein